jgi:hypothetical protein
MGFNQLKGSIRLYLGFGALILIGIAVAGFGTSQLTSIDGRVTEMGRQADNVVRVLETGRLLTTMRLSSVRYVAEGDEALAKAFKDNQAQASDFMKAAAETTHSDERRRLYNQAQGIINDHGAKFDELTLLVKRQADELAKLFSGGTALTAATDKMVEAARNTKDAALIQAAAMAERDVLGMGKAA